MYFERYFPLEKVKFFYLRNSGLSFIVKKNLTKYVLKKSNNSELPQ